MSKKYALFAVLNTFLNQLQTQGDQYFGDISWKQCFVMVCLAQCEQTPSLKELSAQMGCSHQNAKQMLLKMQKLGLVEVKPDHKDRRVQRIFITQKGTELLEGIGRKEDDFFGNLYEGVDASDMLMTIRTIRKMEDNLNRMCAEKSRESKY